MVLVIPLSWLSAGQVGMESVLSTLCLVLQSAFITCTGHDNHEREIVKDAKKSKKLSETTTKKYLRVVTE